MATHQHDVETRSRRPQAVLGWRAFDVQFVDLVGSVNGSARLTSGVQTQKKGGVDPVSTPGSPPDPHWKAEAGPNVGLFSQSPGLASLQPLSPPLAEAILRSLPTKTDDNGMFSTDQRRCHLVCEF